MVDSCKITARRGLHPWRLSMAASLKFSVGRKEGKTERIRIENKKNVFLSAEIYMSTK